MPVRYFYHLTDGNDLIIDNTGRRTRSKKEVEPLAFSIAGELMSEVPGEVDWSEWLVSVQDSRGAMVAVVPFPLGQA
jgi:hypothetical protein